MRLYLLCQRLVLALAVAASAPVHAQSADRADRIDEIVASATRAGFPHLLGDAVPTALRYGVHEALPRLGRERQLGADWKRGDAWYARAAQAADRASDVLAQHVAAHPPELEQPLRAALEPLKDGELEGLLQLYRSPAAPVLLALADAGVSLFVLATLETQRKALGLRGSAMPVMQRLSERIVDLGTMLDADQRAALAQHAPRQALKTLAAMHERLFRNAMRALQPALDGARAQLQSDLLPLVERYDPLQPPQDQ
jgi:hypothetical protein